MTKNYIYYKLWQTCVINWGRIIFFANWGKLCCNLGQLTYYKVRQVLSQIETVMTNQGNHYYKIGQFLQIG